jgi:hypothetical protein
MLIPKIKTAADYRLQAAHIREFLQTVHDDDQLRTVLLEAAARLDQLAEEMDSSDSLNIQDNVPTKRARRRWRSISLLLVLLQTPWAACWPKAL